MLLILACKMRFKYCFSLSSSFLSFIYFIFMLFFRSKRIEASSIVFFLGLFTFELHMRVIYRENKCSIFSSSIFVMSFSGSNIAYYPSYGLVMISRVFFTIKTKRSQTTSFFRYLSWLIQFYSTKFFVWKNPWKHSLKMNKYSHW